MRFSIILATLGRTQELCPLLCSLKGQTYRDFELLVVDQNPDDRLAEILKPYASDFSLRRMRSAVGHSKAFNMARKKVSGEIVCFPDDDCWYDTRLLQRVSDLLAAHPDWSGLTGREIVEPGFTSGGRWDKHRGPLNPANIWRRAITFSIFLRGDVVREYAFDESLGVGAGTPWGAGEETDYLLRLLKDGHCLFYDPEIAIWHQGRSGPYTAGTFTKARRYAMGIGRVLRKHDYSMASVAYHLIRPLGGAVLSLASGNSDKSHYHWSIFAGRAAGWCAAPDREHVDGRVPQAEMRLASNSEDLL
jgi:glycosyltransferase involved in cell wall biosynthesis